MTQYLDETTLNKKDSVELSQHEFRLKQSKELYGDLFNYEKTVFGNRTDKVFLICVKHGSFEVLVKTHINTDFGGCKGCQAEQAEKDKVKDYIERGKAKFNGQYTYEKVEKLEKKEKITLTCIEHGDFSIGHISHMESPYGGCPTCGVSYNLKLRADKLKKTLIILKGDRFSYEKTDLNSKSKVTITCKEHGDFQSTIEYHRISEYGNCSGCNKAGENEKKVKKFIERAQAKHGDQFNYDKVENISVGAVITLICKDHGEFKVNYDNHVKRDCGGCSKCAEKARLSNRTTCFEKLKQNSLEKYGDQYSFEKSKYTLTRAFTITCKDHGDFKASGDFHLKHEHGGCWKCSADAKLRSMEQEYKQKATAKHGNRFDYTNIKYSPTAKYVTVCCTQHGELRVDKNEHLSLEDGGCEYCEGVAEINQLEKFKSSALRKFGNLFNYDAIKPSDISGKIVVKCMLHGDFKTTARSHLRYDNGGCEFCRKEADRLERQAACIKKLKEIHGEAFNYDNTYYIHHAKNFTVACVKHGEFTILPQNHQTQKHGGCPNCLKESKDLESSKELLNLLKEKYGDRFEFVNFNAIKQMEVIQVKCQSHGVFTTTSRNMLRGLYCKPCKIKEDKEQRLKDFITTAEEKYGDNHHDYSLIQEYLTRTTPLPIRCIKHDVIFYQKPSAHLNLSGCAECQSENYLAQIAEKQVKALAEHLGDGYDLSAAVYSGVGRNIQVVCKKHGAFERKYEALFGVKSPCYKCANEDYHLNVQKEFVNRATAVHGDRYDYSETVVHKGYLPVEIKCREHGVFSVKASTHLDGRGNCPECKAKELVVRTKAEMVVAYNKAHNNKYSYLKLPDLLYVNKSITVICNRHGDFVTRPESHLSKGCPQCKKEAVYMNELVDLVNTKFSHQYVVEPIKPISHYKQLFPLRCKEHGLFNTTLKRLRINNNHVCPTCKAGGMNTEILREKITERFGDKILTGMVIYTGWIKPIKLFCRKHKEFSTTPLKALREKFDCPKCKEEDMKKSV